MCVFFFFLVGRCRFSGKIISFLDLHTFPLFAEIHSETLHLIKFENYIWNVGTCFCCKIQMWECLSENAHDDSYTRINAHVFMHTNSKFTYKHTGAERPTFWTRERKIFAERPVLWTSKKHYLPIQFRLVAFFFWWIHCVGCWFMFSFIFFTAEKLPEKRKQYERMVAHSICSHS